MKTILVKLYKIGVLLTLSCLMLSACKKAGETIDSATIESSLSGADGTLWVVPLNMFENETSNCSGIARLLFSANHTYSYTKGTCYSKGTWSATYSANRTGQDILVECIDQNNNGMRRFNLLYSKDNDTFYFVDAVNGLVALKKERQLTWVKKNFPSLPVSFQGRESFVSVEYNGLVYCGLGVSTDGLTYYSDWYKFDGVNFTKLADLSYTTGLKGAKVAVNNGLLSIVGGYDMQSIPNPNTYVYDVSSNTWTDKGKESGGNVQQRSDAVYFNINGREVLGLGSTISPIVSTTYYSRGIIAEPWSTSNVTSQLVYSTTSLAIQKSLCFPWKGGYVIAGGIQGEGMVNMVGYATAVGGIIKFDTTIPIMPSLKGTGFAEGCGTELSLSNLALVYGVNTNALSPSYSDSVYVLENYNWSVYLPTVLASQSRPVPSNSTVLWKVFNPSTQKIEVYGGLGASENNLYQLVIQ